MNNLVLIDGNAVVHRAYHSMPKTFTDPEGNPTNAVYGFALTLIRVIEDLKPEYIVCSFDLAGPTFRHHKFEDYKSTRVKADQELYDQIPVIKQLVETFGIKVLEMQGYEADDVIGTVVKRLSSTFCHSREGGNLPNQLADSRFRGNDGKRDGNGSVGVKIYIVTGDKDTFQLVNGDVFVYDLKQGANGPRIINRDVIKTKYDLEPEDFVDLKALAGDASDNIPGVPGIGDKTATELIHKFGSLDRIYESLKVKESKSPENKSQNSGHSREGGNLPNQLADSRLRGNDTTGAIKPRIKDLLIKHKDQAYLSRELATIHKDVPVEFTLEDLKWGEYDKEKLRLLFEKLNFRSLLARFGRASRTEGPKNQETEKPEAEAQKKNQQLKLL